MFTGRPMPLEGKAIFRFCEGISLFSVGQMVRNVKQILTEQVSIAAQRALARSVRRVPWPAQHTLSLVGCLLQAGSEPCNQNRTIIDRRRCAARSAFLQVLKTGAECPVTGHRAAPEPASPRRAEPGSFDVNAGTLA